LIVFFFSRMKPALALLLFLIVSCAAVRPTTQSKLTGEWRYTDKIQSCHYVFKGDGTFNGEVTYHGNLVSKFAGRWSVEGDALLYQYSSDALHRIPVGATDRDTILSIQNESFTIEAADGSQRTYSRTR
jgi:hypothetical protein